MLFRRDLKNNYESLEKRYDYGKEVVAKLISVILNTR